MRGLSFRLTSVVAVRHTRKLFVLAMAVIFLCSPMPWQTQAAAGDLDSTFDTDGKVTTDYFGGNDFVDDIAIQSNGKIVVAGSARSTDTFDDFALARYNTDGSLDTSFDGDGKVNTDFVGLNNVARAVIIQSDGKIIAVGTNGLGLPDFTLARFNTDGSLDASFGSGGLIFTAFFNAGDVADAVALQPDQKIVVGGGASPTVTDGAFDFAIARYLNDVAVESEFDICIQADGGDGIFQFNSATGDYQFTDCAGITITGTGSITRKGSLVNLDHSAMDRRVIVRVSGSRATASVQLFSPRRTFNIADTNIANNTCSCR